jgi:hypothetical protein
VAHSRRCCRRQVVQVGAYASGVIVLYSTLSFLSVKLVCQIHVAIDISKLVGLNFVPSSGLVTRFVSKFSRL